MNRHLKDVAHPTAANRVTNPLLITRKALTHSRFASPIRSAWSERTTRERRFLLWGGFFILVATLWFAGIAPALSSIQANRERVIHLQTDLARVQAMGLRAQWLRSQTTTPDIAAPVTTDLQDSLIQAGLPVTVEQASTENRSDSSDNWTLRIEQAKVDDLMQWLSRSLPAYNLRVATVSLQRAEQHNRDRPGYVSGLIDLTHERSATGEQQ